MKRRIYQTSDLDTNDEVTEAINVLRNDTANEFEAIQEEVTRLRDRVTKRPKKKGFAMKNLLVAIATLSILCGLMFTVAQAAYVRTDINAEIASNPELLSEYLRSVVSSGDTYVFNPIAAPSGSNNIDEGAIYYDSSANTWYGSTDGSTWTVFETGSTVALDAAYNAGNTIDVDGSAVTLTVSDTDNNAGLVVAQNDSTNDPDAMNITSAADAATAVGLQIDCTAGFDIQGTGDAWSISIAGLFDGEGLTGLTNSQGILFDTNNEIQFGDNSEDIAMVFTNNTMTWATDTSVTTIDWGALTTISGMTTITGDAADLTIGITADAGGEDLLITQAGAVDGSVLIVGAGTGADAISLITSAGGIDITVAGGAAGEDIDITGDTSVNIDGAEEAADAVTIAASGTAGGMTLDYGTGNMVITGTGASADFTLDADLISIDGTGASNITVTGGAAEDFTIAVAGAADLSLILSSTGTAEDALQITTSAGGINVTNGGAAGGEDIDIDGVLASVNINADEDVADAVTIAASTGGIDITADGAAAKDLDLVCTNGSTNISGGEAIANAVTIAAGAGGVDISAAATFDIDITATGGKIIGSATENAAASIAFTTNGGVDETIVLTNTQGTGADAITLASTAGGLTVTTIAGAAGDITMTAGDDLILSIGGDGTFQGTFMPATIVKQTVVTGSLSTADCGYVNQVAVDAQTITLPATVAGVQFWIMNTAADDGSIMTVDCDGADKFIGGGMTPADGEAIELTKVGGNYGDYVKVSAHVDGWIITELVGVWAESVP